MKKRYAIGEVAKFHHIPIGTLRYYDAIGLFQPAEVDEHSGYRYYSLEQFEQLDTICYLKFLGLSLKEIQQHLTARDAAHFLTLLKQQQQITAETIHKLGLISQQLATRIQEIERALQVEKPGVPFIRLMPRRSVVSLSEPVRSEPEIELALRKLQSRLDQRLPLFIGMVGLTVSKENLLNQKYDEYNSVFILQEGGDAGGGQGRSLVEGAYGCIYFRGRHSQSRPYYERLLRFVAEQAYEIGGDAVERTIIDEYVSKEAGAYLTEIQMPLVRCSGSFEPGA